jgi:hypothetical protein
MKKYLYTWTILVMVSALLLTSCVPPQPAPTAEPAAPIELSPTVTSAPAAAPAAESSPTPKPKSNPDTPPAAGKKTQQPGNNPDSGAANTKKTPPSAGNQSPNSAAGSQTTVDAQVGLILNTDKAFPGYTLFAPKHNTATYLIDNNGQVVHSWTASKYEPGQSVYLLENGNLLRACMTKGQLSTGGGEGGRVEEYDWDGNLVWEFDYSSDQAMQHHDIHILPNGNLLMLAVEKKTYAQAVAAGFPLSKLSGEVQKQGMILPDSVVEIKPILPSGGQVVWEWHVWDHLVQEADKTKENYASVAAHPELIQATDGGQGVPVFWNHMNSIDYNPTFDQILLSVRGNSEVWIIDHGTTTAEAAGHTGGARGKGGDLLYRWGNPTLYGAGTRDSQTLFQQHDAEWVLPGNPGAGNITVFNNGLGRKYSTIDEFTPPVDSKGNYTLTAGQPFGPKTFAWTYQATPPESLYSEAISGAQRLANGNTLIDDGVYGTFTEVTASGEVVWKYVNPVVRDGPLAKNAGIPTDPARAGELMNAVFRIYRYAADFPGLVGRDLTPQGTLEQ